jgi:hypothetical protein
MNSIKEEQERRKGTMAETTTETSEGENNNQENLTEPSEKTSDELRTTEYEVKKDGIYWKDEKIDFSKKLLQTQE